ncbi:hypothetical protein HYV86_05765 [Candidatus Woesearchaeota archaeon]|nr:hypothetical protein [Candidatus Woesearchaeota archaeon]
MPPIAPYQVEIIKKEFVTPDLILLDFTCPTGFMFQAGQFISLLMERGEERKPRSYSILNPPSQKDALRFAIKLVDDGFASEIFRTVKTGDVFTMRGPLGHFVLDSALADREHVFIGAGTGIAPFYSMLFEHLPKMPTTKFYLIFSAKNQQELLFHNEFLTLAKKYPHFVYTPTLTREQWSGKTGRVQQHLPKDASDKVFYICGLKDLVSETKQLLIERGASVEAIHFERYN